jgi:hypothetical protein
MSLIDQNSETPLVNNGPNVISILPDQPDFRHSGEGALIPGKEDPTTEGFLSVARTI